MTPVMGSHCWDATLVVLVPNHSREPAGDNVEWGLTGAVASEEVSEALQGTPGEWRLETVSEEVQRQKGLGCDTDRWCRYENET